MLSTYRSTFIYALAIILSVAGAFVAHVAIAQETPVEEPVAEEVAEEVVIPTLSASCTSSGTSTLGETVTWTASVSGGEAPYEYSWTGTDGLSGSDVSASLAYASAGAKTAQVTVVSNDGQILTQSCTPVEVVVPAQEEISTLGVSCIASQGVILGSTVTWTSTVTGGQAPYEYSWNGTDGLTGNEATASLVYSVAGAKTAQVTVVSNDGQILTQNCTPVEVGLTAEEEIQTLSVSCDAPSDVVEGQSFVRTANVTGGQAPYEYSWTGSDNISGSEASNTVEDATLGEKTAQVTVVSNDGQIRTENCSITEVGKRSSNGGGGRRSGGSTTTGSSNSSQGQVLGASISPEGEVLGASCNPFVTSYLKPGATTNDPQVVKELQHFFNVVLGTSLVENGVYNQETIEAVNTFQLMFAPFILQPWVDAGLHSSASVPTGHVFKTTARWINMMSCPSMTFSMPVL